ncbi:MAG: plasmid maintenance system killer protein [Chromatiales bacterium]|nr:plasmid maintenance system killer protein [Chromatiales bacterium]
MIRSWADRRSQRFFEQGKRTGFRGMDVEVAEDLLAVLDAAASLNDLSPLKSLGLHKLTGDRKGQWAMTVNGPWRICFRFKEGDAHEVTIVNYHKG